MLFKIVGSVVVESAGGWRSSRQVPTFYVETDSFEGAKALALLVFRASGDGGPASCHFGMADEKGNYQGHDDEAA